MRVSLAVAASAAVACLAGCLEQRPAKERLEDAKNTIVRGPNPGNRRADLVRISQQIAPTGDDGAESLDAELSFLRGTSSNSLGVAIMSDLDAQIAQADAVVRRIEGLSRARNEQLQIAAAAESVSSDTVNAELRERAEALRGEVASLTREKRDLESRVSDLTGRAEELVERATQLRNDAARVELAESVSATRAAEAAPRVRELTRQADALEQQAARLAIAAEMVEPEIEFTERQIGLRTDQIAMFASRVASNEEKARARTAAANEARSKAAQAETRLLEAVAELTAIIGNVADRPGAPGDDSITANTEAARDAFRNAILSARGIGQEDRARGSIANASGARFYAEANQKAAGAYAEAIRVVRLVLEADPAISGTGELRTFLRNLGAARNEAVQGAATSYADTANFLRQIQSSDAAVRDGLTQTADRYDALAAKLRGN